VDGATTKYEYDALDRLTTESQGGPNVAEKRVEFGYNALGQSTTMNRFFGSQSVVSTAFAYDAMHRLASITHGSAADPVQFFNYANDPGSRITQIVSKTDSINYGYDKRDQLTGADYRGNSQQDESYRYDGNGNRLESQQHGSNYQTEPNTANRLKTDGTYNYEYDANGNQTKRTTIADGAVREFTWDYRNRLAKVTDKSAGGILLQEVSFVYDALDRRIAKTSGGVTTHFVYDREDVLLDFIGASLDTRYFHGPGIDQVLAQEKAGSVQWMLTDHLGSTRAVVDGSGATQLVEYDAYGNPTGALPSRFGFTGREWDGEIELQYFRARYHDAGVGRFISADPLGLAVDVNLYNYVLNSPNLRLDPFGLASATFNGSEFVFYDDNGNLSGVYPSSSGKPGVTNPSVVGQGPIPPGRYTLEPSKISESGIIRNSGLLGDWGRYRVPLKPTQGTDTLGRDGFFLHGGDKPGSAGCIDVGKFDTLLFSLLTQYHNAIEVEVDYNLPSMLQRIEANLSRA